jgi:hypothetical protein
MTSIDFLRVSALGCHPQEIFQIKTIDAQPSSPVSYCQQWNDENIKIIKHKPRLGFMVYIASM